MKILGPTIRLLRANPDPAKTIALNTGLSEAFLCRLKKENPVAVMKGYDVRKIELLSQYLEGKAIKKWTTS